MERETNNDGDDIIAGFDGADYLTSPTSTGESKWSTAMGVSDTQDSAFRDAGKSLVGRGASPVLGFAQLGTYIIIQKAGTVEAIAEADFFA